MNRCQKCKFWFEEFRGECPFCKAAKERSLGKTPRPLRMTQDEKFRNLFPSAAAELEKAKQVKPPASFGGEVPDTPEAAAARRQLDISRGKDVPYPGNLPVANK